MTRISLRVTLKPWVFMRIFAHTLFLVLFFASSAMAQHVDQTGELTLTAPELTQTTQPGGPTITTPLPGDALQGMVTVVGSSAIPGFVSAELAFSYINDPTGTWFLITTLSQPVVNQGLTTWDTSSITDGNYNLRLRVFLTDGNLLDILVSNLRVRNYTPVETPTPAPTVPQATLLPTITLTPTPFPTPTDLPRNLAVLSRTDVSSSIIFGGMAACMLFIIVGIYLWLRRNS